MFNKADLFVSNDLDTLPANYFASILKKADLVYDSHEYFTATPEVMNRKIVKFVWLFFESFIFPKLKTVYTVNNSIAELYKKKYKNDKIFVVRNIAPKIVFKNFLSRADLNLPDNKTILILQGSGINVHRGAEEAVMSLRYLDDDIILLIAGSGDVIEKLKALSKAENLENRVIFKQRMDYQTLMAHTRLCNLGLSLDKATNDNYKYSLPNKIFDYIQAGIPLLVSNMIEVARIVEQYDIGLVFKDHNPKMLAESIKTAIYNSTTSQRWKENLVIAANELCWENESKVLDEIYNSLLNK